RSPPAAPPAAAKSSDPSPAAPRAARAGIRPGSPWHVVCTKRYTLSRPVCGVGTIALAALAAHRRAMIDPTQVAIVVEPNFGERLFELAGRMPVWVAQTEGNAVAIKQLFRR